MILSWLIFVPMIGGALAWLAARRFPAATRWIALASCAVSLGLGLYAWARFDVAGSHGAPFAEQQAPWIPQLGVTYHLAMDGLSLLLVLLTAVAGMVAVAASWREIDTAVGGSYFSLLAVLTGVTGVFLARDLLLFYFFWELMLVPMYFLIGIWGHERRVYAAVKFFLFTFISGLLMLGAILALVFVHFRATSVLTFDRAALLHTPLAPAVEMWLMLGFFVAFATKLAAVPVHAWLADAHTEAPTGGSILLAGLLLKTGAYGMLRFAIPLFPGASAAFAGTAAVLGVVSILYGAMLAFGQTDFKRMVAYSSISHMGFVLLGIYVGGELALQGAVIQILAHGLSTPALFFLAGGIQQRCGTRELGARHALPVPRLGGLWQTAPRLGGFVMFFAMATLGLPGTANFVGEFLVLVGAYQRYPILAIVGSAGFVLSVIYALRLVQESVHGPNTHNWRISDLSPRELAALGVLAAVVVGLGILPRPVFSAARGSVLSIERAFFDRSATVAATTPPRGAKTQ